jgi:GNAT superfamily N-acetyltransferase
MHNDSDSLRNKNQIAAGAFKMTAPTFNAVDASNLEEAMQVLAEAFHDDPVMNWAANNPESLVPFFEITLPAFIEHRLTYLDPQSRGAAAWLGPKQKLKWPMNVSNVVKVFRLVGLKGIYRLLRSAVATEKYHPKAPHYYLFAIGVKPGNKGAGIGTSLITHVLKTCDAQGMPAYLENSKEENLPFYTGHGFKVIRQIRFAASAPPLWLMWREPVQVEN